jgi:hypothetical protein
VNPPLANELGEPSAALCAAARDYVLAGDYAGFFSNSSSRLRHMFHARLLSFRPGLAHFIESKGYNLESAAAAAASSSKLSDDDPLLFFAWSVLRAYYRIPDDGSVPGGEEEAERGSSFLPLMATWILPPLLGHFSCSHPSLAAPVHMP